MPAPRRRGPESAAGRREDAGHLYERDFLAPRDRELVLAWLSGIEPLWEDRFSEHFPPPPGQSQRRLLRPVWWLGNWQFACLGYYRPPRGTRDRCVRAEAFPEVLARLVARIERKVHARFAPRDVPTGWRLNTCLVNLYGDRIDDGRAVDAARVGEHRDFEPGPVASLSIGERALLQFVTPSRAGERGRVALEQWLDDGSLQIFGGERFKDRLFHRVQRVDRRGGFDLPPSMPDFRTRRVNFTFRFVPEHHVVRFRDLGAEARSDVRGYVERLAVGSPHFREELAAASRRMPPGAAPSGRPLTRS